jgi:apolipoprotein N-acyltransferase
MVPRLEANYIAGNQMVLFKIDGIKAGVAICKDMDFIRPAKDYRALGTQVLFVPAFDFVVDDWLHARIAVMRGIENGYSIVRAAQSGLLSISDATGLVLQKIKTDRLKTVDLLTQTPVGSGQVTFYNRTGNWMGWFAVGLSLLCIFFMVSSSLSKKSAKE